MGTLDNFKANNPDLVKNTENYNTINLAIRVSGYEDNKYAIGERLDTKETVKVYLRDVEKTGKYSRPEISDLMKKVSPGGVIKFEGCYLDDQGVYVSRWGRVLIEDKTKEATSVLVAEAYVNYAKKQNTEDEYVQVVIAYPTKKKTVGNMEELNQVMSQLLEAKTPGSNPFVYLKISDSDGSVDMSKVYSKSVEENGVRRRCSGAECVQAFLDGNNSAVVKGVISENDITVELIPGFAVYPGTNYKEKLLERDTFLRNILSGCFNTNKNDQNLPLELGFLKTIITLRKHEDGTPYIIDVAPVANQDDPVSAKDL